MPRRNRNATRRLKGRRITPVARTPQHGRRACPTGKVRFADHTSAVRALQIGQNRRTAEGRTTGITKDAVPIRAYPCPQCGGGFHLTSQAR